MYSYPSDDKTNKSEDDSPHRRKLIRSPTKRVKFTSQQRKIQKVEEILNASAEIDEKINF